MTLDLLDAWWWPYLLILGAGWAMTYPWRALGVLLGGRIDEGSDALVAVRALATALVAAVIGNLIVYPSGPLADTALWLRVLAASAGFATYLVLRRSVLAGIVAGEAVLAVGLYLGF